MEVEFGDDDIDRLEVEPGLSLGYPQEIVRAFRKVMQHLRAAADERDIYAMKSLRFEKLEGKRSHQRSIRLNKQWRIILELRSRESRKRLYVVGIEDYH